MGRRFVEPESARPGSGVPVLSSGGRRVVTVVVAGGAARPSPFVRTTPSPEALVLSPEARPRAGFRLGRALLSELEAFGLLAVLGASTLSFTGSACVSATFFLGAAFVFFGLAWPPAVVTLDVFFLTVLDDLVAFEAELDFTDELLAPLAVAFFLDEALFLLAVFLDVVVDEDVPEAALPLVAFFELVTLATFALAGNLVVLTVP